MLLEQGVGDAFGAGFEYADKHIGLAEYRKRLKDMTQYWPHPKWGKPPGEKENPYIPTKPGCYTDDTQMSIALAELMLMKDPAEWTTYDVAGRFVITFKRDPRPGYAGPFYEILKQVSSADDFLQKIRPHSAKSGGAMRAPVLGLLQSTMQVVDVAMMQASLTHATRDGMNAAAASALLTHYCYHNLGPKTEIPVFLSRWVPGPDWLEMWQGKVGAPGLESVRAAINAVMSHSTLSQVLRACVTYTGDVDTVAAIAMPAASVCPEMKHDLPSALIEGLEKGIYGREFLTTLDAQLMVKFPRKTLKGKKGASSQPDPLPPSADPPSEVKAKPESSDDSPLSFLFKDD